MQISSETGCNGVVASIKVLHMTKTNEMNQIISTIIRDTDEAEYLRLVAAGVDETTAFEQAVNSVWDLSDDAVVEPESADDFVAASNS